MFALGEVKAQAPTSHGQKQPFFELFFTAVLGQFKEVETNKING